jgi:intracellular sulfur oxidation DsrE/DsrF family protein
MQKAAVVLCRRLNIRTPRLGVCLLAIFGLALASCSDEAVTASDMKPKAEPVYVNVPEAKASVVRADFNEAPRLQAQIRLHTADELKELLVRAEELSQSMEEYPSKEPVAFVLYGEEIDLFRRSNYQSNQELVDLAARLEAYQVVDFKVCETWMGKNQISGEQLPAFLDRVHNGAEEANRLEASGYIYF